MFGRRRMVTAALSAAAVVLSLGIQASTGIVVTPTRQSQPAAVPPSVGTTVIASRANGRQVSGGGDRASMLSGNGRYLVFQAPRGGYTNIYLRDLKKGRTTLVSRAAIEGQPGDSTQPSISDNGEYVSFITTATDIVSVDVSAETNPLTLVVCDMRPSSGPPICYEIASTLDGTTEPIDLYQRPRLAPGGNYIAWTAGSSSVLHEAIVCTSSFCANQPPHVGTVTGGVTSGQYVDPVLDSYGGHIAFVVHSSDHTSTLCPAGSQCLIRSALSWSLNGDNTLQLNESSTIRLDNDPGTKSYLGDDTSALVDISNPSIADYDYNTQSQRVAFTFSRSDFTAFTSPIKPDALSVNGSWELVATVHDGATPATAKTKVVSLDNAGNPVDGTDGAISRSGRFVAFVSSITNSATEPVASSVHDGLDPPKTNRQIVVRDLARKVKGALATPSASCTSPPCVGSANSGQVPPAWFRNLFIDDTGSHVSFDSTDDGLVADDQNTGATDPPSYDTFVRTWQPKPQIDAPKARFNVGTVQDGSSMEIKVPVTTRGFGPLTFSGGADHFATVSGGPNPGDFAVTGSDCYQIYSGQDCYVTVKFTPNATGTRRAKLSLQPDQFSTPQPAGTIQGTVGPALHVAPGDTIRTSLTDSGQQSSAQFQYGASQSMISGNGRWDVFVSNEDLAGIQNDGEDNVYVRDLADPQHTVQISQAGDNTTDPNAPSHTTGDSPDGFSFSPSISDDGRFVSFVTEAENIVSNVNRTTGQENSESLVVCDRDPTGSGVFDQTPYACYGMPASDIYANAAAPRLSGDGTKITWVDGWCEGCVLTAQVSAVAGRAGGTLQRPGDPVSVPIKGVTRFKTGTSNEFAPVLTRNGGKVVFIACSGSLYCRPNAVIETTLDTGASVRLDVDPSDPTKFLGDEGWTVDDPPATSGSGSRVAFAATSRVPAAAANQTASLVFASTLAGGTVNRTVVESKDDNGRPAAGYSPALSGNGRYLAFLTDASNMHDGYDHLRPGSCAPESDAGFAPTLLPSVDITCQVVARDLTRDLGTGGSPWLPSELVSGSVQADCPPNQCAGDGDSTNPSLDATGSEIGFDSQADDLVADDTDGTGDTFVHTWRPTLTATAVNFGNVTVGTHRDKTLTLAEPGTTDPTDPNHVFGPISPGGTPVAGPGAADYTVTNSACAHRTLNPGASCTLTVRFTPSALGSRDATIAVDTGADGYPRTDPLPSSPFSLTGVGTPAVGTLTPAPSALDFGKQLPLKPSQPKTVTLTNTGDGPITVTGVTVQDTTTAGASTDYTVNATDCLGVLQPGRSCTVTVTFVGHKTGDRGSQLVITVDGNPTPTTVDLAAKVPKPKVLVNPAVIAPGRVTDVSGSGFAPHRLVDVVLDGFGEHAAARTDGRGRFDVGLVLFRSTPEGPQTVVAQTRHADSSIGAKTPLLVAAGTVDDLQLVTRH